MNHAYTYIIKCPNGKSYYGYRSANKVSPEDDLWKVYFTSSKFIKELREQYGDAEFDASVDKTFESAEEAHEYETKFLTENDCVHSDDWLNQQCFPVFVMTEEIKKKISEAKKGVKLSDEHRKKMSEGRKGMKLSDKHRKSISESKMGENNPMFGWEVTEEIRKKISETKKGVKLSDATKKKMSKAHKGKKLTEKTKRKMSEARKGSVPWNKGKTGVYTEAVIKKMSESRKAYLAKEKRNKENVSIEIHE
jgi:hypothetical protein